MAQQQDPNVDINIDVPISEPVETEPTVAQPDTSEIDKQISRKKLDLASQTRTGIKDVSDLEAQAELLRDIEKKEKEQADISSREEFEKAEEEARVQAALTKYKDLKDKYAQRGIPFKVDQNFETLLAQKEQEQNRAFEVAQEKQQQELAEQQRLEEIKIQQEAEAQKQQIRKQEAAAIAQDEMQKEKVQNLAQRQKELQEQIQAEDEQMKAIDPNRFWNSRTTGQKILAGIGLVLAGMGSSKTGGRNLALDTINKAIEDDIKSQQLNNEQILAKKKHAVNLIELELKKLDSATDNQYKKAQIQKLMFDMQSEQLKLQQQRLAAKKLASADGLTREEVLALDPEIQKKAVPLGSRSYIAFNPEVAKQLNNEVIPNAKSSIESLNRLKEIMEKPASELNPVLRAEVRTLVQSVKGQLRLELFGPGVMTDFENRLADEIIGNPNKILTLDSIQRAKLNALTDKVKNSTKNKIRQAGIQIPESDNERQLRHYMNNSSVKNLTEAEAIAALKRMGKWQQEDLGF